MPRIFLSPPHLSGDELRRVTEAFASNWIAPAGPDLDAFEEEFCRATGARQALALHSGTAALHLALLAAGVLPGDEVLVSSLTVAASVNPILYAGAHPTFIDSHRDSWTMDPALLVETLETRAPRGTNADGRGAGPPLRAKRRRRSHSRRLQPSGCCVDRRRGGGPRRVLQGTGGGNTWPGRHLLVQRQQDHHDQWRGHARLRGRGAGGPGTEALESGPRTRPAL